MKKKTIPQVFFNVLVAAHPRRYCADLFGTERKDRLELFILGLSEEEWASLALDFSKDNERVINYPSDEAKQRVLRILGFSPSGPVGCGDLARELGVSRSAIEGIVFRVFRKYVRAIRYRHTFSVLTPWFEQEGLCFISDNPTEEEYMAADVGVLRLSTRALTVLYHANIKTVGELRSCNSERVLGSRGCGPGVLREILGEARRVGFPLKIQKGAFSPASARRLSL